MIRRKHSFPGLLTAMMLGLSLTLAGLPVDQARGFDTSKLPDLGDASSGVFSAREEALIGRDIVRQIRASGAILEDADAEEYIQELGQHIAAHSSRPGEHYHFFIIRSDDINAFALPGGYIGINAGLIMAADNESELAGVVAHEIAHVTQRHIARQMDGMRGSGLATLGAMIGAILVASQTGHGDVAIAGAMSAQALAVQRQINYTRAHEYEADRIGIRMMSEAGYDPEGMATFFEKLQRRTQYSGSRAIPEYLRTHPLTSARISEARNRARDKQMEYQESSRRFYLVRERLNAMSANSSRREMLSLGPGRSPSDMLFTSQLETYRSAVRAQRSGNHERAVALFSSLREQSPDIITYYMGEGESLVALGRHEEGLELYETAATLFPNNLALMESHARSLLQADQPLAARAKLEDLVRLPGTRARHHHLLARATSESGLEAESHYHMAGYYLEEGDLVSAMSQIRLALTHPASDPARHDRYRERLNRLNMEWERLPREVQQAQRPSGNERQRR